MQRALTSAGCTSSRTGSVWPTECTSATRSCPSTTSGARFSSADVGVVAIKRDVFRDVTLAAKMFDCIAMGLPMVVSRTRSVEQTFPPDCFERFESGNPADLARALRRLHEDPDHRALLATRAAAAADPYHWAHQRERYLSIVAGLLADAGLARQRRGRSRRRPEAVSAAAR